MRIINIRVTRHGDLYMHLCRVHHCTFDAYPQILQKLVASSVTPCSAMTNKNDTWVLKSTINVSFNVYKGGL